MLCIDISYIPRTQMTHILEDLTHKMEGQPPQTICISINGIPLDSPTHITIRGGTIFKKDVTLHRANQSVAEEATDSGSNHSGGDETSRWDLTADALRFRVSQLMLVQDARFFPSV